MTSLKDYSELRAFNYSLGNELVYIQGYSSIGDGAQGYFYWDNMLEDADNDGTIIGAFTIGRWKRVYGGHINVRWFGALGLSDDTSAIQNAINTFMNKDGGTVFFPKGRYKVTEQITINSPGVRLVGESNRSSMIISSCAGITFFVEILYQGTTNTDPGYCKFGIDNLAIGASAIGSATTTGTGLILRNVFADSFNNLFTFGFKKHIIFDGAHLNVFNSLFQSNEVQDDPSLDGFKTTIHNQGIGLSGTETSNPAGEMGGTGNSFQGGWFENSCIDLTNMPGTYINGIDFEPACNSMILGDGAIFYNNRFERFNFYAPTEYPIFPWFVINGTGNRIFNNQYNTTGAVADLNAPIFQINGTGNEVETPQTFFTNFAFIVFGDAAANNTINYKITFADYQNTGSNVNFKNESTSILQSYGENTINYYNDIGGSIVSVSGENVVAKGIFTNLLYLTDNLFSTQWLGQGLDILPIDIPLPAGRKNLNAFAKCVLNTATGNRRFIYSPTATSVSASDVYTVRAMVCVPTTTTTNLTVGPSLNAIYDVKPAGKWMSIRARGYFNAGDFLIPTFNMFGIANDVFYVGEISVSQGEDSAYGDYNIPTSNPDSGLENISNVIVSRSGNGIAAQTNGKIFSLLIQDQSNSNFYYGIGSWQSGIPSMTQLAATGIGTGATNSGGTITIIGSTNYIAIIKIL